MSPIESAKLEIDAISLAHALGWAFRKDPAMGRVWIAENPAHEGVALTADTIRSLLGDIADFEEERRQDAELAAKLAMKCSVRAYQLNPLPARFRRGCMLNQPGVVFCDRSGCTCNGYKPGNDAGNGL